MTDSDAGKHGSQPRPPLPVSFKCNVCKRRFRVDADKLVCTEGLLLKAVNCPKCKTEAQTPLEAMGCPHCRSAFSVPEQLLGRSVVCPHCAATIDLPGKDEWKKVRESASGFTWTVIPAGKGEPQTTTGRDDLVAMIRRGDVTGSDLCQRHPFGKYGTLREACDEHVFLRKLYDPVGAYSARAGWIGAFVFGGAYLIGTVIVGLGQEGWLAPAALGFLAVLLTPTVIGLFVVFVVARFLEVPLLWAYLGALLCVAIAVGLGAVGYFLTRAIVRRLAGSLDHTREVNWDPVDPVPPSP